MKTALILLSVAFIMMPSLVSAETTLNLNSASEIGLAWKPMRINATITNTEGDRTFLNGIIINCFEPGLFVDGSIFFINAPKFLKSGESWTGDILEARVNPEAPNQNYVCKLLILGGINGDANEILASQNFMAQVTPDIDGDGINNDVDQCLDSDLRATVVIDGCDTGVLNGLFQDGCSISDRILKSASQAKNHGNFVSNVSRLTKELTEENVISEQERGRIQSCAARANFP